MATHSSDLLTAGNIAHTLGAPAPQVKKAIQALGLKPAAKKGPCCYYSKNDIPKIKGILKK
jgi:hypothetical protein